MTLPRLVRPDAFGVVSLLLVTVSFIAVRASSQAPQTRDTPGRPPAGKGLIAGTVVAIDSGRPVRRAHVSLTGIGDSAGSVGFSVTTDDLGTFSFADLPAGLFTLAASKPGYLDTVYGQKRPGIGRPGTPIQLADGQRLEQLSLQIARGGAISGTIVDEQGEPVFGAEVRAFHYVMRSGERTLESGDSTLTDDRGGYRIGVLSPGEYVIGILPREQPSDPSSTSELREAAAVIAARAKAGSDEQALTTLKDALDRSRNFEPPESDSSYAPVYFPGSTQIAGATPLLLEPGQERSGVDLQLLLARTAHVSGVVSYGDSAPLQNAPSIQIVLVDPDQPAPGMTEHLGRPGPDGRFSIGGVPPGQYVVLARGLRMTPLPETAVTPPPGVNTKLAILAAGQLWAQADVTTDGRNVTDVSLVLQKGMSVSGTLKLDPSGGSAFDLSRVVLTLNLTPAVSHLNGSTIMAVADTSGRFTLGGIPPGRYRVDVAGFPSVWRVGSAVFGGHDALDQSLEVKPGENQSGGIVTLTTRETLLSGQLQDSAGRPTAAYTIIVFPASQQYWTPNSRRIRATRPSTDGHYAFTNLPAGEYRLVAVTDADPGQWFNPAFLKELAGAALPITLGDGERRIQDLRVK